MYPGPYSPYHVHLVICFSFLTTTIQTKKKMLQIKCKLCMSYTECPRRNVPDFERVFLMLKYTDITQNSYVQI